MTVKVDIFVRNLEAGDRLKEYVTSKASKLDRYLNEIDIIKVDLDHIKSARNANDRYVAQITARGRHALLRTEERADDVKAAFDSAVDKMQRQMERFKGKHHRGGRGIGRSAATVAVVPEEESVEVPAVVARRKTFNLTPMNEAEALEQMKMISHENFFIFFNVETNAINVLYRRRDGTYGLIEPKVG
jgi:putative sigma-54 modulation protein